MKGGGNRVEGVRREGSGERDKGRGGVRMAGVRGEGKEKRGNERGMG